MTLPTGNNRIVRVDASRQRAFSLIELILAMTVLVIMIGVSAPTLANFFHGRALDYEARQLLALTRQGQSRAVSEGVPMELWVDAEQLKYGLQEESSFSKTSADDTDPKAVEFDLDKDVKVEVPNLTAAKSTTSVLRSSATPVSTASVLPTVSKHPSLPRIRFLPDGSIAETSPQMLHLIDRDGASLWLALARHRLNYEIRNSQPTQLN
jgi:prepilin-type N-terminal cleavage/methylation domain-containing protein